LSLTVTSALILVITGKIIVTIKVFNWVIISSILGGTFFSYIIYLFATELDKSFDESFVFYKLS
jgi:hypothetical protein